jgi:predicted site-specific integrase-resolvase
MTDRLLGSTETCERLGIARSTLTNWLESGRIKAQEQLGSGAYVFTEAEVARVAAEQDKAPASP